jgi:hypothetical protein
MWPIMSAGGTLFWILTAIVAFGMIVMIDEHHRNGYRALRTSVSFTLAYLAALIVFSDIGIIGWIYRNPLTLLYYIGIYGAIGAIYSAAKWILFSNDEMRKLAAKKDNLIARFKALPPSDKTFDVWMVAEGYVPKPGDYTGIISMWVAYWPVSMLWSVFHDFAFRLVDFIVRKMGGIYTSITMWAFRRHFGEV